MSVFSRPESLFDQLRTDFASRLPEEMSLQDYLELCQSDKMAYATAHERMVAAIGEPTILDTSEDPRLSRIFSNRKIKKFDAFNMFFGVEGAIEQIVSYFKHAAQGLEERKQILYLLGPVGGGKSTFAEHLKKLMEVYPIYVVVIDGKISPVFESPLGLFDHSAYGERIEEEYGIPQRYLKTIPSPWASKRIKALKGDLAKVKVVRLWPSILDQLAITKTEPGDENNQDISSIVGKVDIRKLEDHSQSDPDAYDWSGALNVATQGIMEYVEMFKAPIKTLNPLLTATQERHYNGTENFGAIPFSGIIMAHSNEAEWDVFRGNRRNEAFLDRVCIVKVPYCLRYSDEELIYAKMLAESDLEDAPRAPRTLEIMAKFSVLTRLEEPANSTMAAKLAVYNGENVRERLPSVKSLQDYKTAASVDEGMTGHSTREAFKILSKTFNYDGEEVSAHPVHLMMIIEEAVFQRKLPSDQQDRLFEFLDELREEYSEFLRGEFQKATLESYADFGQDMFKKYVEYADHWIQDKEYRDPSVHMLYDRSKLNALCEKTEKPAKIANPKDFRHEVVNFVLRYRASHNGEFPHWTSYEKIRMVIENRIFASTEELLPVISFDSKRSEEDEKKHQDFIAQMEKLGYTARMTEVLVRWYTMRSKSA
jgi:serine protein kinase